ncbi:DUF84 family protein [Aquibacillus rhizosphaerae]|uniref:inosine/xanthosine triphosphatase n=1 Tax=Aquibacillus rhizosphaerae TaxID=3051431 RepID=A0ABT7L1X9_9BACI|nr:DUF84 family protein [Aquibacillus sp. LR5S19]MDL4839389.1 DUF84 family protein [Aquibacillus sp. LR5S19]
MKVFIGSNNPAKITAVENVFTKLKIVAHDVPSHVSSQPYSDTETLEGAINRAQECASLAEDVIGIGLEGGVMELNKKLLLCNWGALVDESGELFVASGARIPLPKEISEQLLKGIELGEIMDWYVKKKDVRKNQGAIGIFTDELVGREEMFRHVVKLLKGQYDYNYKQR